MCFHDINYGKTITDFSLIKLFYLLFANRASTKLIPGTKWIIFFLMRLLLLLLLLLPVAYSILAAGVAIIYWKRDCVADAVPLYQYTLILILLTSEG